MAWGNNINKQVTIIVKGLLVLWNTSQILCY